MNRFARLYALAGLALTGLTQPALADQHPVVVEFFTSQGCSSCPPADAYFADVLVGRSDVIALALHVDYWDYIGWKDDLANPAYSDRQRNYARVAGKRSVYTPQMIIGGEDFVIGTKPAEVSAYIDKHSSRETDLGLSLRKDGAQVIVDLHNDQADSAAQNLVIYAVQYEPMTMREIKRGENAGRSLLYANTVQSWDEIGTWDGRGDTSFSVDVAGDMPVAVLVQKQRYGAIVASAVLAH